MRKPLLVCSVVLVATLPVATVEAALTTAASILFESMPFILAGAALAAAPPAFGRRLIAIFGCGCGAGPSAQSLPAAAAAWLMLGPLIALSRFTASLLVAELALRPRAASCARNNNSDILSALRQLLPYALGAGALLHLASTYIDTSVRIAVPLAVLIGLLLGFFASPCALGTVAFATALLTPQPFVALGVLSIGGIADSSALRARQTHGRAHHPLAYLLCALACGAVAAHHGHGFIHPRFTQATWVCAAACALLAWRHRASRGGASAMLAPAIMLASVLLGAPVPSYHASETTLISAFAGEQLDFTGMVASAGGRYALVRYAILCCRADAQPIAVRLNGHWRLNAGTWMRASGILVRERGNLSLQVNNLRQVAAPADPFVYR